MATAQQAGGPVEESLDLNDALASYEAPAEEEASGEGALGEQAGASDAATAAPVATKPAETTEDPFSEAALAAPGGLAKAQTLLREQQKKHDRAYLTLKDRETKFNHTKAQHIQEVQQIRAYGQQVMADVQLLMNGTADQKIDALGRLTRRDGLKVWEELAIGAAGGKKPEASPDVLALREEIRELRLEREQERAQAEERHIQQQLAQFQHDMLRAANNPAEYPALAHFATQNPQAVKEELHQRIVEAHNGGRPITWQQAFTQLDSELKQYLPAAPPVASGLATRVVQSTTKPVVPAQRSPGRSLNPASATQTGSIREMTEKERLEELANDPDFINSLF